VGTRAAFGVVLARGIALSCSSDRSTEIAQLSAGIKNNTIRIAANDRKDRKETGGKLVFTCAVPLGAEIGRKISRKDTKPQR
jgi:hypothetical protein